MTDFEVPEGMVSWAGGDSAPPDWDGGDVRWAVPPGYVCIGPKDAEQPWTHGSPGWYDIIAYTPSTPVQSAGEAFHETGVSLKVDTPPAPASGADEASERKRAMAIIAKSWADRSFPDSAEQIAAEDVWVVDAMLAFAPRPAGEVERLREALGPVMHWYQSDEHEPRSLADIIADAVADLQHDRGIALAAQALMARWPTDQHDGSPLYDEAQNLRAALTEGHQP